MNPKIYFHTIDPAFGEYQFQSQFDPELVARKRYLRTWAKRKDGPSYIGVTGSERYFLDETHQINIELDGTVTLLQLQEYFPVRHKEKVWRRPPTRRREMFWRVRKELRTRQEDQ